MPYSHAFLQTQCNGRGLLGTGRAGSHKAVSTICSICPGIRIIHRQSLASTTRAARDEHNGAETDAELSSLINSNPQFAAALKGALQRQGRDALSKGAKVNAERKPSPSEEVLVEALRQSRRNILQLEELKKRLAAAIQNEERQFERIQFGLKRATADAAYVRTLEKLRAQDQDRWSSGSDDDHHQYS